MSEENDTSLSTGLLIGNDVFTAASSLALCLNRLENALDLGNNSLIISSIDTSRAAAGAIALAPFLTPAALGSINQLSRQLDSTLLQPWDAPILQTSLQISRCVAAAGRVSLGQNAASAALVALNALPPGADDTALQLMAHCFTEKALYSPLKLARQYMQQHKDALTGLIGGEVEESGDGTEVVAFDVPEMPAAESMGKALLAGYAGTWLGFVQEEEGRENKQQVAPAFVEGVLRPQGEELTFTLLLKNSAK